MHTMTALEARLLQAATEVRQRAYAPYSSFYVGAALYADNGEIYVGCNVENAAYPQTQCAEASAIGAMIAGGGRRIVAALVIGEAEGLVTPCGGCRQRLHEFSTDDTAVAVADVREGIRARFVMGELLPASFDL